MSEDLESLITVYATPHRRHISSTIRIENRGSIPLRISSYSLLDSTNVPSNLLVRVLLVGRGLIVVSSIAHVLRVLASR